MKRILSILTLITTIVGFGQHDNSRNLKEIQTDEKFEIIYKPDSTAYSGSILKIIPVEPNFEPGKEQQRAIMNYLITKYPFNEVNSTLTKAVEFIDCGENFESVTCNLCGQNIEMEAWQEVMDWASQNNFNDLTFITPCCHEKANLNDLKYTMPSGFSKYRIEILAPEFTDTQNDDLTQKIKAILGKDIRLIWANY